jgi:hypothetical protein
LLAHYYFGDVVHLKVEEMLVAILFLSLLLAYFKLKESVLGLANIVVSVC